MGGGRGDKVHRFQLSGAQSDNSLGRSLSPPSYYPQCISLRQRGESQRLTVLFVVPSDSTSEMVSIIPYANFSLSLFHPSHPLLFVFCFFFSSSSIAEKLCCFYFCCPLLPTSIMPFSCFHTSLFPVTFFGPSASQSFSCSSSKGMRGNIGIHLGPSGALSAFGHYGQLRVPVLMARRQRC